MMSKMRKKTPKNSNKRRAKKKEKSDSIIMAGTLIFFLVILALLFYYTEFKGLREAAVAVVNGEKITKSELDWWYHTSILPEYKGVIKKEDFLTLSLIPQKVLVQKAKKNNIMVNKEEVEKSIGIFIIENGWDQSEFEEHLASRGITIEQIKNSFEIRLLIIKLFEKNNLNVTAKERLFFDGSDLAIQDYVSELMKESKIEIFQENISGTATLTMFEDTGDELCIEEKPIVRLYTTTKCGVCKNTGEVFGDLVRNYDGGNGIDARHWSLDTGDDLMTAKKESGVPKNEVELFKKYSDYKVPATIIGCKYRLVGPLDNAVYEFNDIVNNILGG